LLDVGDQRKVAQAALRLAADGHVGNYPNASAEDIAARKAWWRSASPWTETGSAEERALWEAVTTITRPRAGA
jgi:hypothetical protein